jgi:hypothetical protein
MWAKTKSGDSCYSQTREIYGERIRYGVPLRKRLPICDHPPWKYDWLNAKWVCPTNAAHCTTTAKSLLHYE